MPPSKDLARELNDLERIFDQPSAGLVVLTGLIVYLGNATFGSGKDYIEMFLWATTVGTAVSLARRLPVADAIAKVAAR